MSGQDVIIKKTKDGVARSSVPSKQSPTSSKAPKGGSSDDTLDKAMKMVNSWLAYRKKLSAKWERDIKLYNNERVQKNYEGVADTFVPMAFSTVETIAASLTTGDLSTDFLPQDIYKYLVDRLSPGFVDDGEETIEQYLVRAIKNVIDGGVIKDESLEVLNALYDYFYDSGDWAIPVAGMVKSGLKIGNGSLWMSWERGRPVLRYVAFPDFIFDPNGSDDDTCKFMGRRYLGSTEFADPRRE